MSVADHTPHYNANAVLEERQPGECITHAGGLHPGDPPTHPGDPPTHHPGDPPTHPTQRTHPRRTVPKGQQSQLSTCDTVIKSDGFHTSTAPVPAIRKETQGRRGRKEEEEQEQAQLQSMQSMKNGTCRRLVKSSRCNSCTMSAAWTKVLK